MNTDDAPRIIGAFANKAKANAVCAVAAVKGTNFPGEHDPAHTRIYLHQSANQLVMEGFELLLKALLIRGNVEPPLTHSLMALHRKLPRPEREMVDAVILECIEESATGTLPLDVPNMAAVLLNKTIMLGPEYESITEHEEDYTTGYAQMDAYAFFKMLDNQWPVQVTQYAGVSQRFIMEKPVIRVNTRVFSGSALACMRLADRILDPEPFR